MQLMLNNLRFVFSVFIAFLFTAHYLNSYIITILNGSYQLERVTETVPAHLKTGEDLKVNAVSLYIPQHFILYVSGFYKLSFRFICCTVNGKDISGKRLRAGMFECISSSQIDENATLSIRIRNKRKEYVIPSTAKWRNRHGLVLQKQDTKSLCAVTMVKNESDNIAEWVDYNIKQGVELFVIYNNNSTDNTTMILNEYKNIINHDWPWKKTQIQSFVHGSLFLKEICNWTLFIDVDEYIFPVANRYFNVSIKDMILDFPRWVKNQKTPSNASQVVQLCFDSKDMGPSGHIKCPSCSLSEAYIHFLQWRRYGKCATKVKNILPDTVIHKFSVKGLTVKLPRSSAHLIHFRYQCWENHKKKYSKGRASSLVPDWHKDVLRKTPIPNLWKKQLGPPDVSFRNYKRRLIFMGNSKAS